MFILFSISFVKDKKTRIAYFFKKGNAFHQISRFVWFNANKF